jgi:3D (Asp-Asp-Asp) domain-containing protein
MKKIPLYTCLFLAAGWLLGYAFHHYAWEHERNEHTLEVAVLKQKLAALEELKRILPIVGKVNVKVTAYSNDPYSINVPEWRDGMTATNKVARRGYVAADWRVFPPGTRLYIPGYGEAVVEDRGGAVKGRHLDLFVETRSEALQWGKKMLDVYVLGGETSRKANL